MSHLADVADFVGTCVFWILMAIYNIIRNKKVLTFKEIWQLPNENEDIYARIMHVFIRPFIGVMVIGSIPYFCILWK
jgi:hypothetical protein